MSKEDSIFTEISKRIDGVEKNIYILRERTHKQENTQGVIVAAVEKLSDQLMTVFENQDKLSAKMIESFKEHSSKFKAIEDETNKIKFVTSHWKTIAWTIFLSCAIGFAFDNGIKDILKVVAGDKISQVGKIISNN